LPSDDVLFTRIPGLFPRLRVPKKFNHYLGAKRSLTGSRWMMRNEVEESAVDKGGWNVLIVSSALSLLTLVILAMLFDPTVLVYAMIPSILLPIVASSLYLNVPESLGKAEERRMLAEAPSIIGCMAMSMQVRPSLEHAVTFASDRGEGVLSRRLREAQWANLTRSQGSLPEALDDLSDSLSGSNAALKHSLHLVITATCERTKQGMDRLLDKANSVALNGVREAVDSYVASLSLPTMVLFSLGTLLPIMLFSVLPLLSLGTAVGSDGSPGIPFPYLAFLLLGVIPISAFAYAWSILSRNPMGLVRGSELRIKDVISPSFIVTWISAGSVAAVADLGELDPYVLSAAVVLTPCAFLGWRLRDHVSSRVRRQALEREATAALFQIGNRMVSGSTFERALQDAAGTVKGTFQEAVSSFMYRSKLIGEGMERIIVEVGSLRSASVVVENAYVTVAQCAERDPRYAGQIALNLAQMLFDLQSCQGKVEEKLRGVVDMMRTTSTLFAPIVLGVTGALFALIGSRTPGAGTDGDIELIIGIYIGQLSLLVAFFTVLIMGERSWKGVAYSFAVRTPIAFLVFASVSLICRTGLSALM
jgi:hypothetical protein